MALDKISVSITKEIVTGYNKLALQSVYCTVQKGETQEGKPKMVEVTNGSVLQYFLNNIHGGASDKNLILLYQEYEKDGSPVKVTLDSLKRWIRQSKKLSTTKSYSPIIVKLDNEAQEFQESGIDMLRITNAPVQLYRQTMKPFIDKDVKNGSSEKNVAFVTYAYAMFREAFDSKEKKAEAKAHKEGKKYTKRAFESVHFVKGELKHETYKKVLELGVNLGLFKLK